jgi:hypothetical protein
LSQSQVRLVSPSGSSPAPGYITPSQASSRLGQRAQVCGRVAAARNLSSGLFVNFDKPYPDESLSVVIWKRNLDGMGRLQFQAGQSVCVNGLVQAYKGKPQIEVVSRDQFTP